MPKGDEKKDEGGNQQPPAKPDEGTGGDSRPDNKGEKVVSKDRFDQVNDRMKAAEQKVAELEKLEAEAAEKAKIDNGKAQEVIDTQKAKIADLELSKARLESLLPILEKQIADAAADFPAEVKAMLDVAETLEKKLELLPQARSLAEKLTNPGNRAPGNQRKQTPDGGPTGAEAIAGAKDVVSRQRSYGL